MNCRKIVSQLNKFAPLTFAESWDNVGLLVDTLDPEAVIKNVMLTNDLTESVMDEAEAKDVKFILSYHPPIFKALKTVTQKHWKERIVHRCIRNSIAVYSPHTAYDALDGGVNDWLASAFGEAAVSPVQRSTKPSWYSHMITLAPDLTQNSLLGIADAISEEYPDIKHHINLTTSSIHCNKTDLPEILTLLTVREEVQYSVTKCEAEPLLSTGMGRRVTLEASTTTIADVIARIKQMTGLVAVRCALAVGHSRDNTVVRSGAVCAGSGASLLLPLAGQVDLIISGEMSHHDVLECAQRGTSVILLEHSNSERGFLRDVLRPKLMDLFEHKVTVVMSDNDRDPLQLL